MLDHINHQYKVIARQSILNLRYVTKKNFGIKLVKMRQYQIRVNLDGVNREAALHLERQRRLDTLGGVEPGKLMEKQPVFSKPFSNVENTPRTQLLYDVDDLGNLFGVRSAHV